MMSCLSTLDMCIFCICIILKYILPFHTTTPVSWIIWFVITFKFLSIWFKSSVKPYFYCPLEAYRDSFRPVYHFLRRIYHSWYIGRQRWLLARFLRSGPANHQEMSGDAWRINLTYPAAGVWISWKFVHCLVVQHKRFQRWTLYKNGAVMSCFDGDVFMLVMGTNFSTTSSSWTQFEIGFGWEILNMKRFEHTVALVLAGVC